MSMKINIGKIELFKVLGICFLLLFTSFSSVFAQTSSLTGEVSFVTSQNVYIRFQSTENMIEGDTIFLLVDDLQVPCLRLVDKSSISCVAERIGTCGPEKGDAVIYRYFAKIEEESGAQIKAQNKDVLDNFSTVPKDDNDEITQEIGGRISVANYTTSGYGDVNMSNVARLSLDVENIAGTKFSFGSYSNFRQEESSRLSVHQAVLTYELDSSITMYLGRSISKRMYSLGATDGLHVEKRFNRSYVGIIAGSTPDPYTYAVNTDIQQYGICFGFFHNNNESSTTSLGFANREYLGQTDRRFAFLQHNSSITDDLSIYTSAEVDLYDAARLRLLYMSANYRVSPKLRVSASINLRKNLILYESFNEDMESLVSNDPLKSSIRLSVNYKISRRLYSGARFSLRKQADGNNSFSNLSGYLNISEVLGGRLSNNFSINRNESFLYYSLSTRFTRMFFNSKLSISPNARALIYTYLNLDINPINNIYIGIDSDYSVKDGLTLSALYDFSSRSGVLFHRFTLKIIQRF